MVFEIIHSAPLAYRFEKFVVEIIEQRKRGILAWIMRFFLFWVSLGYGFLSRVKNFTYDVGLSKTYTSSIPLICIGNITAGGTGKTPFVAMLISSLIKEKKMAVLSRGYRSQLERKKRSVSLRKDLEELNADICGDEVYLLAKQFPQIEFMVGRNRKESIQILEKEEIDLAILDDGYQYRRLRYDKKVVMLSSQDLFGKGHFLPRGYLRDHPKRLKQAHLIVINGARSSAEFAHLKEKVRQWSDAPVVGAKSKITNIQGNPEGNRVGVFCGLGNPDRFISDVKTQLNVEILKTWTLSDHEKPSSESLQAFSNFCRDKGADYLLCSEKDWVKIPKSIRTSLPLAYTQSKMEIVFEKAQFTDFIQTCLSLRRERK